MVTYDSPLKGQTHIKNVREQIQEDIRSYIDIQENSKYLVLPEEMTDDLCQIVVDNFKKLEE
tara:strand:- start:940 stop:1125 length:186 start_codon:yes stop_codon:yes gene_type:complete